MTEPAENTGEGAKSDTAAVPAAGAQPRRRPPAGSTAAAEAATGKAPPARPRPKRPAKSVVLPATKLPYKYLIICGCLLIGTFLLIFNQIQGSALMMLVALTGFLLSLYYCLPGSAELRLEPKGMTIVVYRRATTTAWDDIGGFAVETMPAGPPIVAWWHKADCFQNEETGEWMTQGLRALPELYGMSAPELCALIDSYQDEILGLSKPAPRREKAESDISDDAATKAIETAKSNDASPAAGA